MELYLTLLVTMQPRAGMVEMWLPIITTSCRDTFAEFCHRAHLSVRVEVGYGLSGDHINARPVDVLVQGWDKGKPAAFDITVTSPLTPATLRDASTVSGAAARGECRQHSTNDARCQELGWMCIPLAVETFGNWGKEAQNVSSRLASLPRPPQICCPV